MSRRHAKRLAVAALIPAIAAVVIIGAILARDTGPAPAFVIFAGLVFAGVRLPISLLHEVRVPWPRLGGPIAPALAGIAFAIG